MMLGHHVHTALENIARNKDFLVTRLIALTGGLMAGSCIYMMRYALDYGGWLPNEKGIFPDFAYRSGDSLLIATMILHVDVALWHCLMISGLTFFAGAAVLTARAALRPPYQYVSAVRYL